MKLQSTSIQLSSLLLLFTFTTIIISFKSPIATSSSSNFNSEIPIGYQLTLSIPTEYITGFIGKALLMTTTTTTSSPPPGFTTALVVEAINGQYSCSLDLYYIGTDIRVWSSGHRSKFFATGICVLELTQHGDLPLKGMKDEIGWRTGTTEQGVQKLQLLDSGNLVLMNGFNIIIWQSFNFPTNTLLLQQRLSVATHLTSYPIDSYTHYSLEIQHDKLALYLNIPSTTTTTITGSEKYSYWELQPSEGKNITYVELTSTGLELFDDSFRKFAQIDTIDRTVRFMSVDNVTGNLEMYCYGKDGGGFEPCFQAINSSSKCVFPLSCKSNYSVCTSSGECSCITVTADEQGKLKSSSRRDDVTVDCEKGIGDGGVCGEEEMIEVERAVSVFKSGSYGRSNVSREECGGLCLEDCGCRGVMCGGNECVVYDWVLGVKEIGIREKKREVYMVKVEKRRKSGGGGGLKGWVLMVVVVGDGLILVVVVGGIGYFVVWTRRRKRNLSSL